jgi:methionyl aminopeptidase
MIHLKSDKEIQRISTSCRIAADAMAAVREAVKPGVTTGDLDGIAASYIRSQGAVASAKGYETPGRPPYPGSICISVNDEVVHGIPGQRVLLEGDILAVDIAVKKDGYHGDMNVTMAAGKISAEAQHLVDTTRQAMELGLQTAVAGKRLGDIGHQIQTHVEQQGFSVVRDYCGHGIGRSFHEEPQVLHYGRPGTDRRLQNGMVFTIEPMVNYGDEGVRELDDLWTAVTLDGTLSAQFEHTVAVTRNGPRVLSRFDDLPF